MTNHDALPTWRPGANRDAVVAFLDELVAVAGPSQRRVPAQRE